MAAQDLDSSPGLGFNRMVIYYVQCHGRNRLRLIVTVTTARAASETQGVSTPIGSLSQTNQRMVGYRMKIAQRIPRGLNQVLQ